MQCLHYKPVSSHFCSCKFVSRGDSEQQGGKLPNTSKNSASGRAQSFLCKVFGDAHKYKLDDTSLLCCLSTLQCLRRPLFYVLYFLHCFLYLFCFRYLKKTPSQALKTTAALFCFLHCDVFCIFSFYSISVSAALHALALSVPAPFNCFLVFMPASYSTCMLPCTQVVSTLSWLSYVCPPGCSIQLYTRTSPTYHYSFK